MLERSLVVQPNLEQPLFRAHVLAAATNANPKAAKFVSAVVPAKVHAAAQPKGLTLAVAIGKYKKHHEAEYRFKGINLKKRTGHPQGRCRRSLS